MIRVDVTEHNTRPAKRGRTSATISKPALYSRVAGSTLVVTSCFANTLFITLLTPSTPCTRVRSAFQSARIKALNTVRRAQTGAAGWPLSTSSPRPHVFPRLYLAWPSSLTNNFSFRHPSSSPFFYQNPKLSAEFRIWQESGRMLREGWLKANNALPFFRITYPFVSQVFPDWKLRECAKYLSVERERNVHSTELSFPGGWRSAENKTVATFLLSDDGFFLVYRRGGWESSHIVLPSNNR